jgi:hypothetical protein
MAASFISLLRCLCSQLFIFIACAGLLSFCVSCAYVYQDAKVPLSFLLNAKAPDEKTATDIELYGYISLLDSNINNELYVLSHIKDPVKRAPLKWRIQKLVSQWCKFMRIRTGRFYKKWILDYPRQAGAC